MRIRLLNFVFLLTVSSTIYAGNINWPDLSKTCYVKNRPATEAYVKSGCAAFVILVQNKSAGVPLRIELPQFAMYVDDKTGQETPVVVIQAEDGSGLKTIGYKEVATGTFGVALLREFRLLGTKVQK